MTVPNRIPWVALVFVLCAGSVAYAQNASTGGKKGQSAQVVILSAVADRAHETLTIKGQHFGSQPPQVLCETTDMTVISATESEIVVQLPAAVPDGSYLLSVVRGASVNDRDIFHVAVQTPQVVTGPEGAQGIAGPPGLQGEQGAAGPAGATGPAGPQGAVGPVGPKGDVGPQGVVGPQGEVGPQGAVGPQGEAGPQGAVGPQGLQGEVGAQGAVGPQGPQGDVGSQGAVGAQGDRGPEGPQGAVGPQGNAGPEGPAGLQGPNGLQGPAGLAGPQGPQGVAGVSGYEIVVAISPSSTVPGFGTFVMTANCPAGKHVIAGGYESVGGAIQLTPVASHPVTAEIWRVMLRSPSVGQIANVQVRVFAVCAF